ncbi:MAG: hypothetical protein AAF682_31070 [Planctomycetota bacterium]
MNSARLCASAFVFGGVVLLGGVAQGQAVSEKVDRRVSGDVFPPSGGEGSQLVVFDDFAAEAAVFGAKDVLMLGAGSGGFLGRGLSLNPTGFSGKVTHVSPFGTPKSVSLRFGTGVEIDIPSLDGVVTYPEPGWTWTDSGAASEKISSDTFTSTPLFIDEPCEEMPMQVDLRFRLDPLDGCVKTRLPGPGTCAGDVMSYSIVLTTNNGLVAVDLPATSALPTGDWPITSAYLTFPLNTLLAPNGVFAGYDFGTQELTLCPQAGVTINAVDPNSFVRIAFDPSVHSEFVEEGGVDDDYAGGIDPSSPSAAFSSYVAAALAPQGQRDYDDPGPCNRNLRETFDDYGSTAADGPVRLALYEVHMNAYSCLTTTDFVVIGWDGSSTMDWGESMVQLEALSNQWVVGSDATMCLNLSALPDTGFPTARSVMHRVESDVLDTYVQDDTMVDYVRLRVLRCTAP